jgi:hypothetical protein
MPSVLYGSRDRRRLFLNAGLTYLLLALTDGVPVYLGNWNMVIPISRIVMSIINM